MAKEKILPSRTQKAKETKFGKKKPVTNVKVLLDESGSMGSCFEQTIKGFNEYLKTLASDKDNDYRLTLTKFGGSRYDILYKNRSPKTAPKLSNNNYTPNGMTPLYDAIGNTVGSGKANEKTLFVILTDGAENSSHEYNRDAINKLITKQEKTGWTFIYLGADQDAWANAQHIGLAMGNTMSYDSRRTGETYGKLSQATIGFACSSAKKPTKKFFREHWK